jgi:hypothetical protein
MLHFRKWLKTSALRASAPALFAVLASHAYAQNAVANYFETWFDRVSATQAQQPGWITPLFTVTPRLEEEFRYDALVSAAPNGTLSENYGNGRGLEIIPEAHTELILGVPPYIVHNSPKQRDGAGDTPFLFKYRILSKNKENGDYILTAFLGGSLPSGSAKNGATNASLTPTLAFGKGWGAFDFQSTIGKSYPTGNTRVIGRPVAFNNAFQYRVWKRFWPEVEVNSTFFPDGANAGKKQAFVTPGILVGRIPIHDRVGLTFGVGEQIATTQFHATNHNWLFSLRMPF